MLSFDNVILIYIEVCDFNNDQRNGAYVQLYSRAVRTISSSWKTDIGITVDDLLDQKTPCNGLLVHEISGKCSCCSYLLLELFCFTLVVMFNTGSCCVVILLPQIPN
jgi:hypothetical protein